MLETAEDLTAPRILQLTIFLPNRVGALQRVVTRLEALNVDICALSITDAADYAVVRLIVNRPDVAKKTLQDAEYTVVETSLLGVALPDGEFGIRKLLSALLVGEINVHYVYSFIKRPEGRAALAIKAEDDEVASQSITKRGFRVLTQSDISR